LHKFTTSVSRFGCLTALSAMGKSEKLISVDTRLTFSPSQGTA